MKLVLASLTLTACVSFEDAPAPIESSTTAPLLGCSVILCGENAATNGDGLLFDELDLWGQPNYAGVSMIGANLADGRHAKIDIKGDRLYAYDDSGVRYEGAGLFHLVIHFQHTSGETFDIRLDGIDQNNVRYHSGTTDIVPAYEFKANRGGETKFDFEICNNDTMPERTWTGLDHYALLYRGDRYNPLTKSLKDNDPNSGWSFLACNGSAATKLHLWRHTYAGGFDTSGAPTYMMDPLQRTALLKAITADYCGTGSPQFTVTGTPLVFATAAEPSAFPFPAPVGGIQWIEAEWTNNGAACLNEPRLKASGLTHELVELKCGHPFSWCGSTYDATGAPLGWESASHVVTAIPIPLSP
jgi:hypothetical protein